MTVFNSALEAKKILDWLDGVYVDPLGFYDVEFAHNDSSPYGDLMLTNAYIAKHGLDVSSPAFELAEGKLILEMFFRGVILQGESAPACNWRLKLLRWYNSLSHEEKLDLPIFGNKLNVRRGLKLIPSLTNIHHGLNQHEGVRQAYQFIHDDLNRLGVVSSEYKSVKDRLDSRVQAEYKAAELVEFRRLRSLPVNSDRDLVTTNEKKSFASLEHLFAYASIESKSDSGISNYLTSFKYLAKLLISRGFDGQEHLDQILEPYLLARFRSHLEQKIISGDASPSFANTIMSSARRTLRTTGGIKGLEHFKFVDVPGFEADRVTDMYKPYSSDERQRIAESVNEDIIQFNLLSEPYKLTGIGEDPLDSHGKLKYGFGTIDNARWIFENKLSCSVVSYSKGKDNDPYAHIFLKILTLTDAGLRGTLERWGVHYKIDSWVMAPYVIKLAQITGLNADSLKFLDVDDFVEKHPATGRPCLRYWKERSTGEKMYHLDLFHADITWLTSAQSAEVRKIFSDVKRLTAFIRDAAPVDCRERLFIWQSSAPRSFGVIKSLTSSVKKSMPNLFDSYVARKSLVDDSGAPLSLTPSRLRPSFVSELVERDVTLREIQLILGHQTIDTTISYLDRMDFNNIARKKLDLALRELHSRTLAEEIKADEATLIPAKNLDEPSVIFKTPLAGCTNIFNPPDFVKNSSSYVPGRPCSLYNMCLGCSNSLITASNLPELFAMQRDYQKISEVSRVMDTPYGRVVRENLALLRSILSVDASDFSESELSAGQQLAEFVDTTILIDGVGL